MTFNKTLPAALIAAVLLAIPAVPALADAPATRPATRPAKSLAGLLDRLKKSVETQEERAEDREEADGEAPSTRPADDAEVDADKPLTPAQIIEQMKADKAAEEAKALVVQIDFSSPLTEQGSGPSLFGDSGGVDLRTVLGRFEQAKNDEACKAVLLTFYNGGMMNFAQAQEIRGALQELNKAGKRTFVYADTYDTVSYLVATAATDVCLMDGGEVFIPGVAVEPTFYKGTMDILGIKPQYVQVGEFKGAEEPYTRYAPSPELAGEMEKLVDALYGQIVNQIAKGRSMNAGKVKRMIDESMVMAGEAVEQGFVDHIVDADGLKNLIGEEIGEEEVRVETDYGLPKGPEFDPNNPFALFAALRPQPVEIDQPSVAIVYAEGVITGGEGGTGGLFGESGIGSERIRRAMRLAERDDDVKAVVIRIDSPGGSALASEAMYQAVRRVAETKPVVISIGGMAASGGYYLACAGDHIIADPAAIIGSIGVVGGKLDMSGLYDQIGISTTMFSRGKNAGLFSETTPWDERQRKLIRKYMEVTYDQFTDRVMATRGDEIEDIDKVARGRIFLASEGKKLGMVDELGGISKALAEAAGRAELGEDYDVVVLPDENFNPFGGLSLGLPLGQMQAATLASLIPPHARDAISRLVTMNELLSERPVVVIAPFTVRMR